MTQPIFRCGNCELDSANRRFTQSGRELTLEPKVFAVLVQLLTRSGELLTREQLLDAVWGHRYVTPSTLNRVISLARRALSDDLDPPRLIQTVRGAGYRYIGPIETSLAVDAESRARFGPPASARAPARLQTLIGREHELVQIGDLFLGGRSLTILGTGGMGKTQCALAFAQGQFDRYPDGVWFFDLAPMRSADEWLRALGNALSIIVGEKRDLLGKIAESFAGRRALLLVDNCDRLAGDLGVLMVELLRATDRLDVLATSQQQLNYVGERILRLPPLRLPAIKQPAEESELQEVANAPAVSLLLARIRDTQPDFKLTIDNAPAIVDICERLDGMPLALELAAARFAMLSPRQVLSRLDQRFGFLSSDSAGRDHRHRNLVALLEWSFGLLAPLEQRFLTWLGVFVQGWAVDAVIHLAAPFGSTPELLIQLLSGLVDKSLVIVDQSLSPPRYRLLETVREFALEQLRRMGNEHPARNAHLQYVVCMAEAAHKDMLDGHMRERIASLMREHGNIAAASEYAAGAANDSQSALRIAGLFTQYFKAHGAWAFGAPLCERALAGAPAVRTRDRGLALMCLGVNRVLMVKGGAETVLLEAISICRDTGEPWAVAYTSGHYAQWLALEGRPEDAYPHIETTERVSEQLADRILAGLAGVARGWVALAEEDVEKSLEALNRVRNLGGDFHQHHFIEMYISLCLFRRGDLEQAAARWLEAMRIGIEVGHVRGVAGSIEGCGYIAAQLGKPEQACRLLGAAAEIRRRAGSPLFKFWYRHNEEANAALLVALGRERHGAAITAGTRMRYEDAVNETAALLSEFGAAGHSSGVAT